jgi:ATP10 protein
MFKRLCITLMLVALASGQALQPGAVLPQIKGTSLDEHEITLPDAAGGRIALMIITFTKAGGERGREWMERFSKDYPQDHQVTSYSIAMLEDVPSMLRGLVRGGIKRGVPASMRRRFITVIKDQNQWKQYTGMKDDKNAYLFLLDGKSRIVWTHQGAFEAATYEALKLKISGLVQKPGSS